jgi:hypothetical protein
MAEPDLVDRAVACHEQALTALDEGRPDEALSLAEEAVRLFTAACGVDHPDTANARLGNR